mmetsp:Transcript_64130/g.150506  ORF Transcript_64130/g.150506 Transcript_64130/m.150506 type:complete len:376 (-) Transcript_64130:207-1334(-)
MDSPPAQRQAGGFVAPPPGLQASAPGFQPDAQAIADYAFQSMAWTAPNMMGKGMAGYGQRPMPPASRAPGAHLAPAPGATAAPGQRACAAASAALQSLQKMQVHEGFGGVDMEETTARQRAAQEELAKENARRLANSGVQNVARNSAFPGPDSTEQHTAAENAAKENARRLKNSPLIKNLEQKTASKGTPDPRYSGILKVFKPEHGWGFIENTDLKHKYGYDVFLNQAVEGGIVIGSLVSFSLEISKDGRPQARHVKMEAAKADKPQSAVTGPAADELVGKVFKGRVKSFNATNGFGFLMCDELKAKFGRDIYVTRTQAPSGPLLPGQEYEFRLFLNAQMQPQARELKSLARPEDYSRLGELPTAQSVGEKLFGS